MRWGFFHNLFVRLQPKPVLCSATGPLFSTRYLCTRGCLTACGVCACTAMVRGTYALCAGRYVTFPDLGGRVHASASPPCPEFICKVAPLDRRTDRALGTVENTSAQHITPLAVCDRDTFESRVVRGGESVSTPRLPPPAGGFFLNSDHGKQNLGYFAEK